MLALGRGHLLRPLSTSCHYRRKVGSCEQFVLSDKLSNKLSGNAFQVDAMFTHRQIAFQILFMDPAEGAQKITGRRPQTFDSIGMDFSHAITIVISRPFVLAVTDRAVCPLDSIVALPFIGVTLGSLPRKPMHVLSQSLAVRMLTDSQAALPTLSPNGSDNRWPVIFIRAVPTLLVSSATRRIIGVRVLFAFFPPRSETSRPFQSRRRAVGSGSTAHKPAVGCACATCARSAARVQVPQPGRLQVRPCRHRAVTTRCGAAQDCSRQKWSRCRDCRRSGTAGIGNPRAHALEYGTVAQTGLWHHSRGISVRVGGNTSSPTYHSLVRRVNQLSGRSFPNFNMHRLFT
jgi:hypothetical protein